MSNKPVVPPLLLHTSGGNVLGLRLSRFDERQRRLRLRLPKSATCWDYAQLVDVVRREPGFDAFRFTGKTAAQWLDDLRRSQSPEAARFKHWYTTAVNYHLQSLERRPRIPDNHYCIELAQLPWASSLQSAIGALGLKKAPVKQWIATLSGLAGKGIKPEELSESGVLTRLSRQPPDTVLSQSRVLRCLDLSHITPVLATESRFGYVTQAGWQEICQLIPQKEFKRRGLLSKGYGGSWYVIRFRHQSLGWFIVRGRHRDLFTQRSDLWWVLDEKGRLVTLTLEGFDSPEDAMAFAEQQMSQRFSAWGRDQAMTRWERFSLPGHEAYQEFLLQLDNWPGNYQPRHYRTRNVLVHIRAGVRRTQDGERVLFLDEVQSDWHADLHAAATQALGKRPLPPKAPFRKEWPLLSLKVMIWWAQRHGLDGLAWSSAELQSARWRAYGPPELLYKTLLPEAGQSLAAALDLRLDHTELLVRTGSRQVIQSKKGWSVSNQHGVPITKPFRAREQAEWFADQTGEFVTINVPVLWIQGMQKIRSMPLYGAGPNHLWWTQPPVQPPYDQPNDSGDSTKKSHATSFK